MFSSLFRADAGDRSPWGDFWFTPVSVRSLSGQRVSPETAMKLSAVYACVSLLARSFAVLPFTLYRPKDGGGRERVTDHWLYRLFAKRPNDFQNAFEWREMLEGHLELRGNAFNRIFANNRGEVTDLVPIHPDRIRVEILGDGDYRWRVTKRDGTDQVLTRGEVWHVRGLSSDGVLGMSRIEIAREVIGLGLSAQDYGARFFANDARPSAGWIKYAGKFPNDEAKKAFRESWQNAQTGENRGKVPVLEDGMEYQDPPAVSLKDLQFLELRAQSLGDVARIFGVQPHLIGDLSRATNNNIEQQALEFVTYTMTAIAERWEAAIEAEFLFDDEDLEVEFDFKKLLRGDMAARSAYWKNGVFAGIFTRNEARDAEGFNPIEGLDEPLQPVNMIEAGQEPPPAPGRVPAAPDGEKETSPDDGADARLAALASAAAQRIARKETLEVQAALAKADPAAALREFYGKHAGFVEQALEVSAAAAVDYCAARLAFASAAAESKAVEIETFTDTGRLALMKLALKGER